MTPAVSNGLFDILKNWKMFRTPTSRIASFLFLRLLRDVLVNSYISWRRGRTRRVGAAQQDLQGAELDDSVSHWHSPSFLPPAIELARPPLCCPHFYFLRLKDEGKSRADIRISVTDFYFFLFLRKAVEGGCDSAALKMHGCVSQRICSIFLCFFVLFFFPRGRCHLRRSACIIPRLKGCRLTFAPASAR